MNFYTDFDYLCDEPFFVQGIGCLKCPTLREIRKITYNVFFAYMNIVSCTQSEYLKFRGLEQRYNALSESHKQVNSLFNLLLYGDSELLIGVICTFVKGNVAFDDKELLFRVYNGEVGTEKEIGHIGNDNFDDFREQVKYILGIKTTEDSQLKFKNKLAQTMYEKMQKSSKEQIKKSDNNMTLDNMIKKYCTHNKVGINILNVWDLTYYQFMQMFAEYCNGRQYDFNDMIAANTFNYKKSSDYKPQDYMKKLKNS